jgi:hypothetical protein
MSQENLEIVRKDYLMALERKDIDVVHHGVEEGLVCHGRKEVVRRMRANVARVVEGIRRLELVAAGDCVVLGPEVLSSRRCRA